MIKNYIGLASFLLVLSCASEPSVKDEESVQVEVTTTHSAIDQRTNLNISLLIDLSDRIDTSKNPDATMQYYQRDTGYIASVVHAFNKHVLNKKLILIDDRIQTFIDPLPQNKQVVTILEALKVDLNKNNVTKEMLLNLSTNYTQNAARLYQDALRDGAYIGSDTWRFFKSSVKDYCIKDDAHNVLVILTDGYMYHGNSRIVEGNRTNQINKGTFSKQGLTNSNWKTKMTEGDFGFPPATSGLDKLKVLVIGLNPYPNNPFEEDVLVAYWEDWLGKMGVQDILVKRADLPVNLDESIQAFILSP